jgi:hypothetical protein
MKDEEAREAEEGPKPLSEDEEALLELEKAEDAESCSQCFQ